MVTQIGINVCSHKLPGYSWTFTRAMVEILSFSYRSNDISLKKFCRVEDNYRDLHNHYHQTNITSLYFAASRNYPEIRDVRCNETRRIVAVVVLVSITTTGNGERTGKNRNQ